MKIRTQLHLITGLMLLAMAGVAAVEAGFWLANRAQTDQRNYVMECLEDVFELNLLTHELNLFRDTDRPIDQMELKLKVLTERFKRLSAKETFSTSEIEAIKSTIQSIEALLYRFREAQKKMARAPEAQVNNEFFERLGAQLLQRAQTLYGAFSLMRERLSDREVEGEYFQGFIRGFFGVLMGGSIALTIIFLYRYLLQSLAMLEEGAVQVAKGNRTYKFEVDSAASLDEIGAVKSAFNTMVTSLNEALGEIHKKNRELETLLYVVSHDLKEPLRSVEYFSKIVYERNAAALDPEAQDYLKRSVQGAARLRHLLDDILVLSKARKVTTQNAPVSAKEIVAQALDRLEHVIKESGAEIKVEENLRELKVDPVWALEAVCNLMSNAVKYVKPGQRPEIKVSSYQPQSNAETRESGLVVEDRGPGVPPELAERIFELFQRGVGRDVSGTGAGLAIVKAVAERHGGRAWVEPREGGGSRFVVTFKS